MCDLLQVWIKHDRIPGLETTFLIFDGMDWFTYAKVLQYIKSFQTFRKCKVCTGLINFK
ncbi:hypothetical protein MA16_Dca025753 [Dendrobium catenatum]|uniref:Uncharacterized protein n=2 Tax=Dendrobium TaxID=37818 RepID=A0A2I0WCA8_9ASPA|nr:hypothetical protein MA16_Dca025753 [Dendrobium catenatum]